MAKEDIVKVLKVDVGNSETTVKKLKDEIQKLNEQIKNTNTESGKLVTNNNQLGNAIDDTTGDIDQASKSYNSLVLQMKALKKEWRAATDEVERASLGEKIVEVNNELKEMDATIGNFQRNVGNYEQSFSSAMGKVQQNIQPTLTKFEAIQKTAAGLTSGIAALTGTMALFGIENEDVQKSLLKVQSAMAIAQGVGGLKDLVEGLAKGNAAFGNLTTAVGASIKSMSAFKLVLTGLGIGAGVAAMGALVYAFSQMFNATEKAEKSIEGANKQMEESLKVIGLKSQNGTIQALEEYIEKLNAARGSQDKLNAATKWFNDEQERISKKTLKDEIDALVTRKQSLETALLDMQERVRKSQATQAELSKTPSWGGREARMSAPITNAVQSGVVESNEKGLKKIQDDLIAVDGLLKDKEIKLKEIEGNALKRLYEDELEGVEVTKTAEVDKYNTIIEKLKEAKALQEEELRLKEKERQLALQKQKDYLNNIDNVEKQNLFDSDIKFQAKELDTSEYELINLRIEALNEERRIRQEAFNERMFYYDELLANETLTVEESIALEKEKEKVTFKWNNEVKKMSLESLQLSKERTEQEVQLELLKENAKLGILKSFLSSAEKVSSENFWISRGLASAQAAIDTYQAANAAYAAMAGIPVVGPALGIAARAAAIAAGLANVHQIWQIDEKGKETQSATASAAATPSFNLADSLPVQYSRNVLTDRELDEMNQPVRVYVLENDITNAQKKVRVTESNATF